MEFSKSSKKHDIPEANQDLISNLPTVLTDKILKLLPLRTAAKMSALSRKWRQNWYSHGFLVFDRAFRKGRDNNAKLDWKNIRDIINNIVFLHNGPIHKFYLEMLADPQEKCRDLSPWISFLSRIGVKKMILINWCDHVPMPSRIFECKELVKLKIQRLELIPLPSDFKGFACLRSLELIYIDFKHDMFPSFIASCPRLTELVLEDCTGISSLVIDNVPTLERLTIQDDKFESSLAINNVLRLKSISLIVYMENIETVDAVKTLARQCELQQLQLGGHMCKLFGVFTTGCITESLNLAFNHLCGLCLTELDLGDFDEFCFTIGMLQSCPFLKNLEIAVNPKIPNRSVVQHKFEYNENYKLGNLRRVVIKGITGSSTELTMIKYVLSISVVLEELLFRCHNLDLRSELKMSRQLLRLPRASTKAKLVCLE